MSSKYPEDEVDLERLTGAMAVSGRIVAKASVKNTRKATVLIRCMLGMLSDILRQRSYMRLLAMNCLSHDDSMLLILYLSAPTAVVALVGTLVDPCESRRSGNSLVRISSQALQSLHVPT